MRTTTIGLAERRQLRSRPVDTAGLVDTADLVDTAGLVDPTGLADTAGSVDPAGHRRADLAAGLGAAAIVGQILFAQVTLLAAVILVAVGRVSRWRPRWLAVSALASLIWLVAAGPARAAAAYADGSRRLAAYILESAAHPGRLAHPAVALAGAATWLPRELPVALLAACAEAWLVLWLGWRRRASTWRWRPGLVAAGRRRIVAGTLSAGEMVTSDGFALGLVADTGRLASVSWSEAADGVLLTGQDADQLGLAVACAAFRRRKTVLILDCTGQAPMAARISEIARQLGVPITQPGEVTADADADAAADAVVAADADADAGPVGRAIRRRETVLMAISHRDAASRAAGDLAGVLGGLRELGLRADCLTWIRGAECLEPARLTELLALGPLTGNVVVVSTTSPAYATALARETAVVVISGPVGTELAQGLTAPWTAASILAHQRAGEFTVFAGMRPDTRSARVTANCRVVPIAPDRLR